jgi:single-strand DNA-binding protein
MFSKLERSTKMLNQVIIVGRLAKDPKIAKPTTYITLAVQSNFKNADGIYETDFIKCTITEGIAQQTFEYIQKGSLLGIKGYIKTDTKKQIEIIVERVTFLSNRNV